MKHFVYGAILFLAIILSCGTGSAQIDFNKDLMVTAPQPINDLEIYLLGAEVITNQFPGAPGPFQFANFQVIPLGGMTVLRWSQPVGGLIPPGAVIHVGFSTADTFITMQGMCFTFNGQPIAPVYQVSATTPPGALGNLQLDNLPPPQCPPPWQYFVGNVFVEYYAARQPLPTLNPFTPRVWLARLPVQIAPVPIAPGGQLQFPLPPPPPGTQFVVWTFDVDNNPGLQTASHDFIQFPIALGKIEGTKFRDHNGNGTMDQGDEGIPNWPIHLTGQVNQDIVTDQAGDYSFVNLPPGHYSISEDTLPGWLQTAPPSGSFAFDVTTGSQFGDADFGNLMESIIQGVKYNDLDGDGQYEPGEPPMSGWIIALFDSLRQQWYYDTTDAAGAFAFGNLKPGIFIKKEFTKAGWVATAPPGIESGVLTFITTDNTIDNEIILNFQSGCISGVKYYDRNHNGVRDAGEEGLDGWTIMLDGITTTVTADTGKYEFCNVGPGQHTICEWMQASWIPSCDTCFSFVPTSGFSIIHDFCNLKANDTIKYRTFSSDDWVAAAQKKPIKKPKFRKPGNGIPNLVNAMDELFKKMGKGQTAVIVGVPVIYFPDHKTMRPYIQPSTYKDALTTFWSRGVEHADTIFRGLDFYNNWTLIKKKLKSLPASKQNNDCVEDMMGLACNLALSDFGFTQGGLGELKYFNPGNPLSGMTVREIKAYGDQLMSIWDFHQQSDFETLSDVVSSINNAFSCGPPTFDCEIEIPLDTAYWMGHTYMRIKDLYTLIDVPFLHANPGAAPYVVPSMPTAVNVPEQYALYQNFPNPFNPVTTIQFDLPEASVVSINVYNVLGQEVATLLDRVALDEGMEEVEFDASGLPSGVYFYRIIAQNHEGNRTAFNDVKKMILVK